MKLLVEQGDFDENEVVLRCREMDGEILDILSFLRDRSVKFATYKNGEIHMLLPADIFYAEAVEGKTFIYTKDMVLESNQSLAALQDAHGDLGILRISKSQLVNLHHVGKLKSLPNSRIEITLKNGEKMIVSRHYVQNLKDRLGMSE